MGVNGKTCICGKGASPGHYKNCVTHKNHIINNAPKIAEQAIGRNRKRTAVQWNIAPDTVIACQYALGLLEPEEVPGRASVFIKKPGTLAYRIVETYQKMSPSLIPQAPAPQKRENVVEREYKPEEIIESIRFLTNEYDRLKKLEVIQKAKITELEQELDVVKKENKRMRDEKLAPIALKIMQERKG